MTHRSKYRLIWTGVVLALVLVVLGGVLFVRHQEQQLQLDQLQQEALAELKAREGTYDPQSIVLTNTSRTKAEQVAALSGGSLRITETGSFAVVTLPEGTTIYDFFSREDARDWIPEMSADYQVASTDVEVPVREIASPNYYVDDPDYDRQSYLDYLNIQDTWYTTRGSGITVAVIDTGIDTDHPEFAGKISEYSYNATEDKIVKDYDLSLIEDKQGHGTAVAGVIAAAMNDGNGIVGIAPDVTILVIKAECDEKGNFKRGSDLVFGLYYAIERDANIVNMSFGSAINIYADAAQLAVDSDVICVAAAGNEGSSLPQYPAADENVIGVGALAPDSWNLATYSNYGDNSDIVAPGTVYTCAVGGGYKPMDGTSFSSPVAASAIALYLSQNPYTEFTELTEVLYASCADLGDLGEDAYYGYGALDIHALVLEEKGTITFEMLTDEVENIQRVYVKGHTLQNIPVDIERNYAAFDGWYYGYDCAEGDELELYTTVFTEDITLYANWVNEDDGIPYTYVILEDGTVEIRCYTGRRRFITIPDKIEGRTVSSIGEGAFKNQTRLREVTLPSGLVRIRDRAFYGCSVLTNVNIPDGVTEIGANAFADCARMRSISFGAGSKLQTIGRYAFQNTGLLRFELPKTVTFVDGSAFFGTTSLIHIGVAPGNAGYASENGVLFNATKDILVAYPAGLGGEYALGAGVSVIGDYAFGYSAISNVDLAKVTTIGGYAFACSKLESVVIPDSVTALGEGAFANCRYLRTAQVGSGVVNLPEMLFRCNTDLTQISLAENITSIGGNAFSDCISLENLDLSTNTQLVLIDAFAFSRCKSLKTVKLAEDGALAVIGTGAFAACQQLSSINFPKALTVIGSSAFEKTDNLTTVTFPDNLKQIGEMAFLSGGLSGTLTVPKGVDEIGAGAFADCDALTYLDVQDGNQTYIDVNGVVYTRDGEKILAYPAGNTAKSYTVPDDTLTVGSYAFCGTDNLTGIGLPESLTYIEEYGFCEVTALRSIAVPDNVTHIGRYAFSGCWSMTNVSFNKTSKLPRISFAAFANTGITSFRVPANVSTVAQYAFSGSCNLQTLTFAAGSKLDIIPAYMLSGSEQISSIIFEKGSALRSIAAHGLEGMTNLTSLDFSNTKLTNVDNFAFRFNKSLKNVILPQGVTYLGRYAFYACTNLKDVSLPASIDYIGRYAFLGAENANVYFAAETLPANLQENWDYGIRGYYTGVTNVAENETWRYATLTNGGYAILDYLGSETHLDLNKVDLTGDGRADQILNIGGYAFADTAVVSITLPDELTMIQRYAFARTENLKKIAIPAEVEFIGQYAFYGSGIESLTFESGAKLHNIEQYAFSSCRNLGGVTIPDSVKTVGTGVFAESGIRSVTFGTGLTEIPDQAFYKTRLTEVKLPASVEKIGYYAFAGTETLKTVTFATEQELMVMGYAFSDCDIESVSIPANVGYLGEFAFTGNKNLQSYTVAAGNGHYTSENGILYNKAKTKLIAYPAGRTGSFEVPSFVETIGFGAFENSKLTKVTFAQGINLLSIGNRAFYGAALTEITIPASVVSIDYYAFATCEDLETVIFAGGTQLKGIYEGAFLNCSSLSNITVPDSIVEISDFAFYGCRSLKVLPLGENSAMKGVYDYAFAYTGLEGELVLPDTLIDIGNYAFAGLKALSIQVSDAQRYELVIGLGAFAECNELMEITLPFVGAMEGELELGYLGYIFGAGSYKSNATYVPESLKTVTLLEGTTTLPTGAFYDITTLETVNVPHSVENVYRYSFIGCPAKHELTNIVEFWYANWDGSIFKTNIIDSGDIGRGLAGYFEVTDSVTEITYGTFSQCHNLKSVNIPDSVTHIGDYAFSLCSNLSEINLPCNISSIGDFTFSGCTSLTNITIPNSVTVIDQQAFFDCKCLDNVTIPEGVTSIASGAFSGCSGLTSISLPESVTSIDIHAFAYCDSLTSISIPDGVTTIPGAAFLGCDGLTSISIPESVTVIEGSAFYSCSNLTSVTIPRGVEEIGDDAFYNCTRLGEVVNKSRLPITMGSEDYGCVAFNAKVLIDAEGNRTYLDESAGFEYIDTADGWKFSHENGEYTLLAYLGDADRATLPLDINGKPYRINLSSSPKHLIIPDGMTQIDDYAFYGSRSLVSIYIPDSVTSIGANAFKWCTSLASIDIPGSVTIIGHGAFGRCDSLTSVSIPEGVTVIEDFTFEGCDSLVNVSIPDSVGNIGDYAFHNCSSLTDINIPNHVTSIGANAFYACSSLKEMYIPSSVESISATAFSGCVFDRFEIAPENAFFTCIDQVIYDKAVTAIIYVPEHVKSIVVPNTVTSFTLQGHTGIESVTFEENSQLKEIGPYAFSGCTNLTSITIPTGVTWIGYYAFSGCSSLTSAVIPEGVTSVETNTFSGCISLTSVNIPDSVTSIGYYAFSNCSSLTEITIPDKVTVIEDSAFSECSNLISVVIPDAVTVVSNSLFDRCIRLTSVTIPSGVTSIGYYAFRGCSKLTDITIPESVTSIREHTFSGCWSLTSINIPDGVSSIGDSAFSSCDTLMSVTLPAGLTSIGANAFHACDSLWEIVNKSSLPIMVGSEDYGKVAYNAKVLIDANGNATYKDGCNDFQYVDTLDGWRFANENGAYSLIAYVGEPDTATLPTEINGNAFQMDLLSSPEHLVIPYGVQAIEDYAFYFCLSLKSITIPDSVTRIGDRAFWECGDLTSIIIPDGVLSIGEYAFLYCDSLTDITISDSVTSIGYHAFEGSAYYDNPANWENGILLCDGWILAFDDSIAYMEEPSKMANGLQSDSLKKIIVDGTVPNDTVPLGSGFPNLETLVFSRLPEYDFYWDICYSFFHGNIPITLKNIVIPGGAGVLPNARVFENITGVEIWVNATKEDCGWDENYPGWNNGNIVHYADEWIEVTFTDADGRIVSNEYLSIYDVIKQPYMEPVTMDGDTSYTFLGWDIDGDGQVDSIPVTSPVDIRTTAVYQVHVHPTGSHTFGDVAVKDPTCVSAGYSQHNCTVCGYTERFDYVNKLGHQYGLTHVDAGCEHIGGDKYTCQTCGDFYFENVEAALGHKVDKWTVKAASCTADGSRTGECTRCGETVTEVIPATGHNYTKVKTVEPTCTEKGQEIYQCTCGHRYAKELPETGHNYERVNASRSFIQWLISLIRQILWGWDGDQPYYYQCTECRQIMLAEEKETPSHGGPSANAFCIHSSTVETVEGNLTTAKCESCGAVVWVRYDGDGNECDHNNDAVVTAPTCTDQGYTTYTCGICGESYVDDYVEALGHDLTHYKGQAPTCTEKGWAAYETCSRCDHNTYQELAATGHHFENGVCTGCGQEEKTYVLGDVNGDGRINVLDAGLIVSYYTGVKTLDETQQLAADVNGDGRINVLDAGLIVSFYTGVITAFPAEQ